MGFGIIYSYRLQWRDLPCKEFSNRQCYNMTQAHTLGMLNTPITGALRRIAETVLQLIGRLLVIILLNSLGR